MQVVLAYVRNRAGTQDSSNAAARAYLERCSGFMRGRVEGFKSEQGLLEWLEKQRGRTAPLLALLDERGRQFTSAQFAAWLGARRDEGVRQVVFAVGPADGWTDAARGRAQLLLSLGPMTMAHELARVVVAEQIYRAVTILTGHPYHRGS